MSLTGSRFDPVEELIHGALVRDPYRWLEDRSLPETEAWIREQQRRCNAYFAECEELSAIRERVRECLDVDVVDQPARVGDRYFYRRRARRQEQGCIYVRDAITGIERSLVDLSADGPFVSVGIHRVSNDGSLLAYERKHGGEDKKSIHIVDVEAGVTLSCGIARGYARGFAFSADNRSYYYCHELSSDEEEHTIRLHLPQEAAADQVVFRAARSRGSRLVLVADSVHLGAIWVHEVAGEMLQDFWMAKQTGPVTWHRVFANKRPPFIPTLRNGHLFAISYENAENGKLVELNRDGEEVRTVIHEQRSVLRQFVMAEHKVFVLSQNGLHSSIQSWSHRGEEFPVFDLPPDETAALLPDLGDGNSLFLSCESFTRPPAIFEYIPARSELSVWHERSPHRALTDFTVRAATYSSLDGAEIPITLVGYQAPSDAKSPVPVIMTSYGGFGVPMTPQFSVLVALMLECGAIFAIPHIRGGGEFGKAWHDAGRRRNRQTSFDDFLAAAEWLYRAGITSPSQLAIFGGSNSGLLVGVAMTQRPELFRAVLCIAPLLDMIRYEHFDQAMKWREEYGSCESTEDFQALYAYSPYHRIQDNTKYPAVLFVVGDKDDRCNPLHVRKMAALLLENSAQANPVLVDYSDERGHSPVLPLNVRIDALAHRIAFLCRELNLPFADGACYETACA